MFCTRRLLVSSLLALTLLTSCSNLKPQAAPVLGKWGFINKKGTFIVKPQFDEASEFTEKGAIVRQEKRLIRLQANPPGESNTPVGPDDKPVLNPLPTLECAEGGVKKYKIMDGTDVLFDPNSKAEPPAVLADGGLICAKFDTQYAYIDKTGALGIPRLFQEAKPFVDGRAAVKEAGRWGYINKKGSFVIPPKFLEAGTFYEGLAPVKVIDDSPPK